MTPSLISPTDWHLEGGLSDDEHHFTTSKSNSPVPFQVIMQNFGSASWFRDRFGWHYTADHLVILSYGREKTRHFQAKLSSSPTSVRFSRIQRSHWTPASVSTYTPASVTTLTTASVCSGWSCTTSQTTERSRNGLKKSSRHPVILFPTWTSVQLRRHCRR